MQPMIRLPYMCCYSSIWVLPSYLLPNSASTCTVTGSGLSPIHCKPALNWNIDLLLISTFPSQIPTLACLWIKIQSQEFGSCKERRTRLDQVLQYLSFLSIFGHCTFLFILPLDLQDITHQARCLASADDLTIEMHAECSLFVNNPWNWMDVFIVGMSLLSVVVSQLGHVRSEIFLQALYYSKPGRMGSAGIFDRSRARSIKSSI